MLPDRPAAVTILDVYNAVWGIATLVLIMSFRVRWWCGMCGKVNFTNTAKYIMQYCDHSGDAP